MLNAEAEEDISVRVGCNGRVDEDAAVVCGSIVGVIVEIGVKALADGGGWGIGIRIVDVEDGSAGTSVVEARICQRIGNHRLIDRDPAIGGDWRHDIVVRKSVLKATYGAFKRADLEARGRFHWDDDRIGRADERGAVVGEAGIMGVDWGGPANGAKILGGCGEESRMLGVSGESRGLGKPVLGSGYESREDENLAKGLLVCKGHWAGGWATKWGKIWRSRMLPGFWFIAHDSIHWFGLKRFAEEIEGQREEEGLDREELVY